MADILGYDPNRDSGIAEPRSYVELGRNAVAELQEARSNY